MHDVGQAFVDLGAIFEPAIAADIVVVRHVFEVGLAFFDGVDVDEHEALDLEPETGVEPKLGRAGLVGGLLVDFVFEDGDVLAAVVKVSFPALPNAFPDVLGDHLHAV